MREQQARAIVNEVFALYEKYGNDDYIGEPVSQLEHMCQSAQLAEKEGYSEEIILAAFFHDIGHLCEHVMEVQYMDGYGVTDHESLGGDYLRQKGFSDKIAKLVASHVTAKRYLTYKFPDYYEQLSPASRITLDKQGGVMTHAEAVIFEVDELHPLYVRLREWDDKAKKTHQLLPSLEKYRQMALRHLLAGS
jgi:phosphonate degradation associated HDIG domain protein